MSIIRVEKTKNYTIISNYHFREKNMSLKAKGLLSLMLSLPENWDYSIAGLVAICKENETSIKTALDELKQFGYLEVIKKMPNETKTGRIEYEYIVYEQKIYKINTENIEVKVGKELLQEIEKQDLENLGVEVQGVEKPIQYNNKQLNTNNKINNNILCVFDFWNKANIINHREITPIIQKAIEKVLKLYTLQDVEKCITRYSQVVNDKTYYFNYKWTLQQFLSRKEGMPEFMDDGGKWLNYCEFKKKGKNVSNFTERNYDESEINVLSDLDNLDIL